MCEMWASPLLPTPKRLQVQVAELLCFGVLTRGKRERRRPRVRRPVAESRRERDTGHENLIWFTAPESLGVRAPPIGPTTTLISSRAERNQILFGVSRHEQHVRVKTRAEAWHHART